MPPAPQTNNRRSEKEKRQLERLETLLDVIYGVVIVLVVYTLPSPESPTDETAWRYLVNQREDFIAVGVGLMLMITYWLQNNAQLGHLGRTDTTHTALSILQTFLLLAYLFAFSLGIDLEQEGGTLVLQSLTLGLMGVVGIFNWTYASRKGRLLSDRLPAEQIRDLRYSLLPEPLTAGFTLPFALLGPDVWTLAWLAYPVIAFGLNRLKRRRQPPAASA